LEEDSSILYQLIRLQPGGIEHIVDVFESQNHAESALVLSLAEGVPGWSYEIRPLDTSTMAQGTYDEVPERRARRTPAGLGMHVLAGESMTRVDSKGRGGVDGVTRISSIKGKRPDAGRVALQADRHLQDPNHAVSRAISLSLNPDPCNADSLGPGEAGRTINPENGTWYGDLPALDQERYRGAGGNLLRQVHASEVLPNRGDAPRALE